MNLPSYARAAARLLRQTPRSDYWPGVEGRRRGVATIERAMATRRRRRFYAWGGVAAAAAASLILVGAGLSDDLGSGKPASTGIAVWGSSSSTGVWLQDGSGSRPLAAQSRLVPGSTVVTQPGTSAALELSTGTALTLTQGGQVSVMSVGKAQRFRLSEGALEARVAKLGEGERFVVDTPDAVVEVRGTVFLLNVVEQPDPCTGLRTRLSVSEGLVSIRGAGRSALVAAGQAWPPKCEPPKVPAPKPKLRASEPPTAVSRAAAIPSEPKELPVAASETPVESRSLLAQQNDEFQAAVRARRSGDVSEAIRRYQQFAARYPASPLAQNASVEAMRLLARSDRARAERAARGYLKRYPKGFARTEAKRLLTP